MRRSMMTLCCALVLAAPASAQGGAKIPPSKSATAGGNEDRGKSTLEEEEDRMNAERARGGSKSRGVPKPVVATTGPARGDHLFTPTAYLRPRRLGPGATGALHVVVTLGSSHVVIPGSVAELKLAADNGPLKFGVPVLDPAAIGTRATKFKGTPIYEDVLLFKVPVTIDAQAAERDHAIRGVVRLFLHDGPLGHPLGEFVADVRGSATVGATLVNSPPETIEPATTSRAVASATPDGSSPATPNARAATASSGKPGADVVRPPSGSKARDAESLAEEPDARRSYWIVGGAVGLLALAVLGLLLFSRRR